MPACCPRSTSASSSRRTGSSCSASAAGVDICKVSPAGSGRGTLLTGAVDPSWSADQTQIAFVDPVNGVSVANADGTGRHGLGAGVGSTQPTFSPDGQRIAYVKT